MGRTGHSDGALGNRHPLSWHIVKIMKVLGRRLTLGKASEKSHICADTTCYGGQSLSCGWLRRTN